MRFHLMFLCDNAAFEEGRAEEVARILEALARDVQSGAMALDPQRGSGPHALRDANGNTVGHAEFTVR